MEQERCCGTCEHHRKHIAANKGDRHIGEWWCDHEESDAYGDFTTYSDCCECYEEREK